MKRLTKYLIALLISILIISTLISKMFYGYFDWKSILYNSLIVFTLSTLIFIPFIRINHEVESIKNQIDKEIQDYRDAEMSKRKEDEDD